MNDHLDGFSFGVLAVKYGISKTHAWELVHESLEQLPDNNKVSVEYCNRFSAIYVCDGKYIPIKGQSRMPLLWGVDYFTHDLPCFFLAPAENYSSWAKFFMYFHMLKHYPQLLVCDDNANIKMAARHLFPLVKIQTCTNHFSENIRRTLQVRSDTTYGAFSRRIDCILQRKLSPDAFNKYCYDLAREYETDMVALSVLANIKRYQSELTAFHGIHQSPTTTNLIECLNSHLESRLVRIRSFNSTLHARLWLNAYILKKRYTKLTGYSGKFRFLNGKKPIEITKKKEVDLPTYF